MAIISESRHVTHVRILHGLNGTVIAFFDLGTFDSKTKTDKIRENGAVKSLFTNILGSLSIFLESDPEKVALKSDFLAYLGDWVATTAFLNQILYVDVKFLSKTGTFGRL